MGVVRKHPGKGSGDTVGFLVSFWEPRRAIGCRAPLPDSFTVAVSCTHRSHSPPRRAIQRLRSDHWGGASSRPRPPSTASTTLRFIPSPPSPPLQLEMGAYQICGDAGEGASANACEARSIYGSTDAVFMNEEEGVIGVVDCGHIPLQRDVDRVGVLPYRMRNMLDGLYDEVVHARAQDGGEVSAPHDAADASSMGWAPRYRLSHHLTHALQGVHPPEARRVASALALCLSRDTHTLHAARVGTVGLMVVRDGSIVHQSTRSAQQVLHRACQRNHDADNDDDRNSAEAVQLDVVHLCEGDVIIAATDGFFDNVSESQVLALLSPVTTAYDATLAVANHTCLATFTHSDPVLSSYMLAQLAHNFATCTACRPFLSELSTHFVRTGTHDDVSVVVAHVVRTATTAPTTTAETAQRDDGVSAEA
eukprot:ctg_630.g266